MKKIAVITATRAEYGLLTPLIRRIDEDKELELELIVTGAHLSESQGYTITAIQDDGFPIAHEIPILDEDNTPYGISVTMANAIKGFAKCFRDDRPDMIVILGDRTEMLGVASAALNERIPIAHIHGGEVTEGAVDDCIRHVLTKMSYLHFTSTEVYRKRVIQMGEDPDRVFNVGALGVENILHEKLLTEDELRKDLGIPREKPYVVVTFHPVTMENDTAEEQMRQLCGVMDQEEEFFYVITKANTDAGGEKINTIWEEYVRLHGNALLFSSLGMRRYLSAVKYAAFVLGNSSSGILEAPVLGTPTVNIGDRQKGRIMAETVVCCEPNKDEICLAVEDTKKIRGKKTLLFGDGNTSEKIVAEIKVWNKEFISVKKCFFDLER